MNQPRPQRQATAAPAARDNGGQRGGWQRGEARQQQQARPQQARPQQARPQQVRQDGQQGGANEVRRNLPGWAGGTRNGEPVSRTNPPQGGNYRPDTRGNDRNRDRDRGSDWQRDNDGRNDSRWQNNGGRNNDGRGNDGRGNDGRYNNGRDNDGRYNGGRNNDGRNGNDRWRGNDNQNRNWDRNGWRRDTRYDWQGYRDRNRSAYRIGRYYAPYQNYSYRRLGIGFSLGSMFYGNRYWINDPWQYRLPAVYGPYRWVRYYDDVVLVDIYSGEVVDVIYDFFW